MIAGPSSGMALAGALKLIPDEPGVVCVVVFPDNAFKYTTSFKKHLPQLFPTPAPTASAPAPTDVLQSIQSLAQNSPDIIEPGDAEALVRQGASLLDVRTPAEYEAGHIAEAVNLPLAILSAAPLQDGSLDRAAPIVTICGVGKRSVNALLLLKAQGFEKVKSVRGGMQRWNAEGRRLRIREPIE